jgi:hypothetical protein
MIGFDDRTELLKKCIMTLLVRHRCLGHLREGTAFQRLAYPITTELLAAL